MMLAEANGTNAYERIEIQVNATAYFDNSNDKRRKYGSQDIYFIQV